MWFGETGGETDTLPKDRYTISSVIKTYNCLSFQNNYYSPIQSFFSVLRIASSIRRLWKIPPVLYMALNLISKEDIFYTYRNE